MNEDEARLKVYDRVVELLCELAVDDDMSDDERATTAEMMAGVGEMLLDYLHFTVTSVENGVVRATVALA